MLAAKTVQTIAEARTPLLTSFESLGSVFLARLQSERLHLVSLSAALAGAEYDSAAVFEDLQFRARRLRGAANILEASEVAASAAALEGAASAAARARASHAHAPVWAALIDLIDLLGKMAPRPIAPTSRS